MATILTKKSDTASSVPLVADLTNAAGGAELAVNTADKRLFTKTSGGTVVELGTNPSSMTLPNGTANAVPYLNASKVLTSGSDLVFTATGLGIGTSSPQTYLHIRSTSGLTPQVMLGGTSSYRLDVGYNNSAEYGFLQAYAANTSTYDDIVLNPLGGNLGLGVTPSAWSASWKAFQFGRSASTAGHTSVNAARFSSNEFDGTTATYLFSDYATRYEQYQGQHKWYTAPSGTAGNAISFTQAMTLDASGNLLVGTTVTGINNANCFTANVPAGWFGVSHVLGTSSGTAYMNFGYGGSVIGSITQNGTTGVLYNLTSDYRLKNNPVPVTGAKEFINALQPKTWDWWDGSGKGVGFIAHEFMEVAQYSGNGVKDAVETVEIKDDAGNVIGTEDRPIYQSIQPSSSEVMANLVAYVQELRAEFDAYKAAHP